MNSRRPSIGAGLVVATIVLVGVGLWQTTHQRVHGWITVVRQPRAVMGTTCTLAVVVPHQEQANADDVLQEAETALRMVEARMSTWLAESEISRFNAAATGQEFLLSPDSLDVLRAAREAAALTSGTFDATCRPVIELWKQAGHHGVPPTELELACARDASSWEVIELTDKGAIRQTASACVDLSGLAKGYAIDRAAEALGQAGIAGGLVDVGGDLVCFGRPADGEFWPVDVKDPFGPGRLAQIHISEGAVATSGNYARYVTIAGKRYGHIIDPRVGRPTEAVQSVTVVAPTAVTADIWATAISVLGPKGLERLPDEVEALMVMGSEDDCQMLCTTGFRDLLGKPFPQGLIVWEAGPRRP